MSRLDDPPVLDTVQVDTVEEATALRRNIEATLGQSLPPLQEELRRYAAQGRTSPN